MEDFKRLCDDVYAKGMKIIIDCVYNHTSPDSVLAKEHQDWFYHKKDGSFGNKVGDWRDVIDLDYSHRDLWKYQAETLVVAGPNLWTVSRCDVAPMVPVEFWKYAREEVQGAAGSCCGWLNLVPGLYPLLEKQGGSRWVRF